MIKTSDYTIPITKYRKSIAFLQIFMLKLEKFKDAILHVSRG